MKVLKLTDSTKADYATRLLYICILSFELFEANSIPNGLSFMKDL